MTDKITITRLSEMKQAGNKITSLTAYDACFARILDEAGVDIIIVGDSLGMVLQGADNTLGVTINDMVYHTKMVDQGRKQAMLVADMPFKSYSTTTLALKNAERLMNEGGADVIKVEGGKDILQIIRHFHEHDIPVCGHLGLQPQSILKYGGFYVQGRDEASAQKILTDAMLLQDEGVALLVLECIPVNLATKITESLQIPTIGIGAGVNCDGQVLVVYDVLGISPRSLHMSKNFLEGNDSVRKAVSDYIIAVKDGSFPAVEHSFE